MYFNSKYILYVSTTHIIDITTKYISIGNYSLNMSFLSHFYIDFM